MKLTSSGAPTLRDVGKMNRGRENFYAFISRLFAKELDEESLKMITAAQKTVDFLASSQQTQELKEGSNLLREFVDQTKALEGTVKQDLLTGLAVEYADLFLGVQGRTEPLLICESAYLGKFRMYHGRPLSQVRYMYRMSGFEKREDFHEPEDHIAVELDFMANLCKQTHLSLEEDNLEDALRYLKVQKEFLRDHLLKWVTDLCENLKMQAQSKLYKSLAYITNGFTSMEAQVVDEFAKTLEDSQPKKGKPTSR